jgi:hypothetical protein
MDDRSPDDAARMPEMTMPLDDEQLSGLVRAAVSEWQLPPQRLDAVSWRDRIAVSPARLRPARLRSGAGGTVAAPLAAAALLTVFALVATSFGVAWLNARPAPGGASTAPGSGTTPGSEATPAPQRLPEFAVSGAPVPGNLLVQDEGVVKLLDLSTGKAIASLPNSWPGGAPYVYELPGGGYVHVNIATEEPWGSDEQGVVVTVRVLDAQFRQRELIEAGRYLGVPDASLAADRQPFGASAWPSLDPSGRYLFLGWSKRVGEAWQSGVDVWDLESARLTHQFSLPAAPATVDGVAVEAFAPVVHAQADGSFISIGRASRDWTVMQGPGSEIPDKEERWWVVRDGKRFGDPQPWIDPTEGVVCRRVLDEGFAAEVMYFILCQDPRSGYVVRIQDLAEGGLHDVVLEGMTRDDSPVGIAIRGSTLWVWRASGAIAAVDLNDWTARTVPDIGVDRFEAAGSDALQQLAEMLVPTAIAKPWHEDGASRRLLVASADGSMLFALRPTIWNSTGEIMAPPAIWLIDATTLEAVGHWKALAAWESLKLSEDGRFLFLAAPGGLDANGQPDVSWKSSLVVLDSGSGEPRLVLGRAGEGGLRVGTDPLG